MEPPKEAGEATRTVLTIDGVLMSDAGLYRLIAKNADGESIATVMLNTDGAQTIFVLFWACFLLDVEVIGWVIKNR